MVGRVVLNAILGGKKKGKNVEFPLIENIFSECFKKLKVSDYYRKSKIFRVQR